MRSGRLVLSPCKISSVGHSEWTYQTAGIVNASPERIMAWWYHPDRRAEFQDRLETAGHLDVSVTESMSDGVRVWIVCFKDRRGWVQHHQIETHLTPDGTATRDGDRFIAPSGDVVNYDTPDGQTLTTTCTGQIEFIPQASGESEISVVHHHKLVGGSWLRRWSMRRSEPRNSDRVFQESIIRCQAAVGRSAT